MTPAPSIAPPVSSLMKSFASSWLPASIPIEARLVSGVLTARMFRLLPMFTVE